MHGPMWHATLEYVKRIELRDTSAHALPDAHCVIALWRVTWPWQREIHCLFTRPWLIYPTAIRHIHVKKVKLSVISHEDSERGQNVGLMSLLWHLAQLGWQSSILHTLYPQENYLVLVSVKGWMDSRAMDKRNMSLKNFHGPYWESNPQPPILVHSAPTAPLLAPSRRWLNFIFFWPCVFV